MKRREFYAFASPSIFMMVSLMLLPLVLCVVFSLERLTFGTPAQFVGLRNYIRVLSGSRFWNAMVNTLIYIGISIPVEIVLGFSVAMLLDRANRLRGLFIGGSLLPHILTPAVGALVVSWLFRDYWGFYDFLLSRIGIHVQWYAHPWGAKSLIIVYEVWQNTPFVILVFFAGLQALPREPIEAAIVDGATALQRMVRIVIPMLSPLLIFIVLMRTMDAYRVFDSVFVMTGGGPGSATELVTFYNYLITFKSVRIGEGSAISVLVVIGIMIILSPLVYITYKSQLEVE